MNVNVAHLDRKRDFQVKRFLCFACSENTETLHCNYTLCRLCPISDAFEYICVYILKLAFKKHKILLNPLVINPQNTLTDSIQHHTPYYSATGDNTTGISSYLLALFDTII